MLKKKDKEVIIKKHKKHEKDTGSHAVQIALLSKEIKSLLNHLKKHPKDIHSKRGLLNMVSKRRKLLKYLETQDPKTHKDLIKEIGLKS